MFTHQLLLCPTCCRCVADQAPCIHVRCGARSLTPWHQSCWQCRACTMPRVMYCTACGREQERDGVTALMVHVCVCVCVSCTHMYTSSSSSCGSSSTLLACAVGLVGGRVLCAAAPAAPAAAASLLDGSFAGCLAVCLAGTEMWVSVSTASWPCCRIVRPHPSIGCGPALASALAIVLV